MMRSQYDDCSEGCGKRLHQRQLLRRVQEAERLHRHTGELTIAMMMTIIKAW